MKNIFVFVLISCFFVNAQSQTLENLERLSDSLVNTGFEEKLIPGFAVSIIHDNYTFKKGYGFSNLDTHQPVDTSKTLFQIGSVGKLFTAIAVLQLVEDGKLALHKDINSYLKEFQVPNEYPTPITLFHLLTHTPGLNDHVIGYSARSEKDLQPLSMHLKENTPTQQREPGKEIDYSNYGYALAGHLVEIVSGQSFQDYVQQHIFVPLGMNHTSYYLPDDYDKRMEYAHGYKIRDTGFVFVKTDPRHPTPAGGALSTVDDMTRFLKELMNPEGLVLNDESYQQLVTRQFGQHPLLLGYSFGLEEQERNGVKGFGKGGAVPGFLTAIAFYPEKKIGMFLATNTQTDNFMESFSNGFFDYYFPPTAQQTTNPLQLDLSLFEGTYTDNRTNKQTIEEIVYLYRGQFDIWITDDNQLGCYHNGAVQHYQAVDSLVFQNTERSQEYMVFEKDKKGVINKLYRNVNLAGVYVPVSLAKVSWYDDPFFINEYYFLVLFAIWLFILILPFRWWVWWKRRKEPGYMKGKLLPAGAVSAVFAVLILYTYQFLKGFMYFFQHTEDFFFGVPAEFKIAQYSTYLIPVAVAFLVFVTLRLWWKRQSNIVGRIIFSLVTVLSLIHLLFMYRWHFIGLNFI